MDEEKDSSFTCSAKNGILDIGEDLRDDNFFKLVEDFLGPQCGEGLNFDDTPCKNRFLIQVGLMREDNQIPWGNVVKWLKNIFPMYQSCDFCSMIEKSIATALNLRGGAREIFLDSDVNFEFVGPVCDTLGIGRTDLLEMTDFSDRVKCTDVTNGLMLELSNFVTMEKIDPVVLVSWLRNFNPLFCGDGKIQKANKVLQSKLKKFKLDYRMYQRSRSRRNRIMEKFLQEEFELVPKAPNAQIRKPHNLSRIKKRFLSKYQKRDKKLAKRLYRESGVLGTTPREMFSGSLSQHGGGNKLHVKSLENAKENVWKRHVKSEPVSTLQSAPINKLLEVKEEYDPSPNQYPQAAGQVNAISAGNSESTKAEALTLLDVSMLSLQKLSSVYGEKTNESKQVSKDLLQKHLMLMLDEDPIMKAFSDKVTKFQKVTSPLHFLDCNTNFLHEVSDAVDQQILAFEREIISSTGEKLGRDKNPKFSNFVNFSESAASRYVQMACDVLSPRGETKHSCRKQWLHFCQARGTASRLAVSQSNRFNNYFEAAAGLIHHHTDIIDFFSDPFLSNSSEQLNVIQESVRDDANDQVIQALVCVLAIVYCKILGPYWQLLKSSAEYVYFHRYVHCLHQSLVQWSEDSSLLLLPEYSENNMFHQFPLQEKNFDGVFSYCRPNSENQYATLIRKCLEKIMKTIAAVTEANLKDFLPGGVFCQDPAPELSAKLRTCQLSHLMREYPFGHAKPYRFKRQGNSDVLPMVNSLDVSQDDLSVLQRNSCVNELNCSSTTPVQISQSGSRRNTTIPQKGVPCSPGKSLKSSVDQLLPIPREDLDPMEKDKLLQDITTKNSVIDAVAKNGGPCASKQDVDHLLAKLDGASHAQKREAIRCEISYQKLILGSRDKNLNHIGFSLTDMINKLKMVLPEREGGCTSTMAERSVQNMDNGTGPIQQSCMDETTDSPECKPLFNRSINMKKNKICSYKNYRENFSDFDFTSLHD